MSGGQKHPLSPCSGLQLDSSQTTVAQLLRALYILSSRAQSPWSLAPAQMGPRQGREGQMVGRREAETERDRQKQNHTIKQKQNGKQRNKAETIKEGVCAGWFYVNLMQVTAT